MSTIKYTWWKQAVYNTDVNSLYTLAYSWEK